MDKVTPTIKKATPTVEKLDPLEQEFIEQLTPFQQIAYKIAINNLESSFSLEKCIGFLEFKENKLKEAINSASP